MSLQRNWKLLLHLGAIAAVMDFLHATGHVLKARSKQNCFHTKMPGLRLVLMHARIASMFELAKAYVPGRACNPCTGTATSCQPDSLLFPQSDAGLEFRLCLCANIAIILQAD